LPETLAHLKIGDNEMTTATKARVSKTATRKPRRDVTQSSLPVREDGQLDLVAVLQYALTVPGRMSQCYNKFYRYSFLNMLLVLMQTGRLEPMATYKRWNKLGRNVISGTGSALFVNHPKFAPARDRATGQAIINPKTGKPEMKFVGAYPKATVFQLFQTDGPELELPDTPDWDRDQAMKVLDIKAVKFSNADGNVQGYTKSGTRSVAINPVAEAPFKTMIHEWAHILCGHNDPGFDCHNHRGVAEFQAEAVSLLVCSELNIERFDDTHSRSYIQGWLRGTQSEYFDDNGNLLVTDSVVRKIFSVTDEILVAGRKRHYDKVVAEALAE
jgi:antirestriction protein ArdC